VRTSASRPRTTASSSRTRESGKSFAFGNLVLDALAAGDEAILVDNGNSWEPLTALLGCIHIPVDIKTSAS
jgi:hypothetical protein